MQPRRRGNPWRVVLILLCVFAGLLLGEVSAAVLSNVQRSIQVAILPDDSAIVSDSWSEIPRTQTLSYNIGVSDAVSVTIDCGECIYERFGSQIVFHDIEGRIFVGYRSPSRFVMRTGPLVQTHIMGHYNSQQNVRMDVTVTMTFPITYSPMMSDPEARHVSPGQATWQFENKIDFSVDLDLIDTSRLGHHILLPSLQRLPSVQRR